MFQSQYLFTQIFMIGAKTLPFFCVPEALLGNLPKWIATLMSPLNDAEIITNGLLLPISLKRNLYLASYAMF